MQNLKKNWGLMVLRLSCLLNSVEIVAGICLYLLTAIATAIPNGHLVGPDSTSTPIRPVYPRTQYPPLQSSYTASPPRVHAGDIGPPPGSGMLADILMCLASAVFSVGFVPAMSQVFVLCRGDRGAVRFHLLCEFVHLCQCISSSVLPTLNPV